MAARWTHNKDDEGVGGHLNEAVEKGPGKEEMGRYDRLHRGIEGPHNNNANTNLFRSRGLSFALYFYSYSSPADYGFFSFLCFFYFGSDSFVAEILPLFFHSIAPMGIDGRRHSFGSSRCEVYQLFPFLLLSEFLRSFVVLTIL